MNSSNKNIIYIPSELLKISNINSWKKRSSETIAYYYKHFSYFHQERSKILEPLKTALNNNHSIFEFNNWNRLVSNKYSTLPLSSRGSLLNDPGGRFNIGNIDEYKFQSFPALYIAQNFETAYRERFQQKQGDNINGLSPEELLLGSDVNSGFTNIVLKGKIYHVLDLTEPRTLHPFYQAIKSIKLPNNLKKEAKSLKLPIMQHVRSLKELKESVLSENWRDLPMQVDIPSNSQILGQIAELAGIEALLYPSSKTSDKHCLAIFPRNFKESKSYVTIGGDSPESWQMTTLDKDTCSNLY